MRFFYIVIFTISSLSSLLAMDSSDDHASNSLSVRERPFPEECTHERNARKSTNPLEIGSQIVRKDLRLELSTDNPEEVKNDPTEEKNRIHRDPNLIANLLKGLQKKEQDQAAIRKKYINYITSGATYLTLHEAFKEEYLQNKLNEFDEVSKFYKTLA